MQIELKEITIREIFKGYKDSADEGIVAYSGKLDIRPPFQREFVYKEKQRDAVIQTIFKGFPLNVMYWCDDGNGNYELLDGQQRTISICQYINGDFSIDSRAFHNLTKTEQDQILDYKLMIYFCKGNDKEKLDWFKTINIAGEQLTNQELLNAIYTGEWLSDAKRHFSKPTAVAKKIANDYLDGDPKRQVYLEKALEWICDRDGLDGPADYMSEHQHDTNANEIWLYFKQVIDWIEATFPTKRKIMKGLPWGKFYNKHHEKNLDPKVLEEKIKTLIMDDEVQSKKGIYEYLLTGSDKTLDLRAFSESVKLAKYEECKGICKMCEDEGKKDLHYEYEEMEGDHIVPWSKGGKTVPENCQMLCMMHNRTKSNH